MATSLVIEEERGTCSGHYHPHNGYYAGDFSTSGTSVVTASEPTAAVTGALVFLRAAERASQRLDRPARPRSLGRSFAARSADAA